MATNNLSKTRRKFIKVKDFAEQCDMSDKTVYQRIKNPIFEEAVRRIGSKGIRLDEEKMIEIMEQYYRWKEGKQMKKKIKTLLIKAMILVLFYGFWIGIGIGFLMK